MILYRMSRHDHAWAKQHNLDLYIWNIEYAQIGPQTESEPCLAIPGAGQPHQSGALSNTAGIR